MKIGPLSTSVAILLLLAGSRLPAEESMGRENMTPSAAAMNPPAAKPKSRTQEILQRFDKNGDGRLDEDEKAAAHEVMLEEQMTKEIAPALARAEVLRALALELFDRNHDGSIDETERLDAAAFVERGDPVAVRETLLARFDKNHDGKLDEAEHRESQLYSVEHRGELTREILLRRYDANENGQLEPEEKTAVRAAFMSTAILPSLSPDPVTPSPAAQARGELLRRFDADGNGRLDAGELRAARESSPDQRVENAREAVLKRFDKNGDGMLSNAEQAVWMEELKAKAPAPPNAETAVELRVFADEIERRRLLREQGMAESPEVNPTRKFDDPAVTAELARRRALRRQNAAESTPAAAPEEKK